jgi:geranylgeranyl diphosphate synthase, type I
LREALPAFWPGLARLLAPFLDEPLRPEALLPIAACRAVGSDGEMAVPVAAATLAAMAGLRMLDDLADADRADTPWGGAPAGRAAMAGAAAQLLWFDVLQRSPYPDVLVGKLTRLGLDTLLSISAAQDSGLAAPPTNVDEWWELATHKTADAFASACAAGALVGTEATDLVAACARFGHHLGLAVQVLNDLDAATAATAAGQPVDPGSLPGLLAADAQPGGGWHAEVVRAALDQRRLALDALGPCPDEEGVEALASYVVAMFADLDVPSA